MKSHFWTNEYGNKIFCLSVKATSSEKGCIGFVHGLGEHISRYAHVFRFFVENGYSVYGFDSFGHGRSEGTRGDIRSKQQWLNEIQMLMEWMNAESQAPKILYGHSMGGLRVLAYAIANDNLPDLAVVCSPFVKQSRPEPRLKVWAGKLASRLFPSKTIDNGLEVSGISRIPEEVQAYANDPYNHSKISLRLATIAFNTADWLQSKSHHIPIPMLLHHGTSDRLTAHDATLELSQKCRGDMEFCSWENGYHELHNDLDKELLLRTTLDWLNEHLPENE